MKCSLREELESEYMQEEGYLEAWKKLSDWVKMSKYYFGKHQWLEKYLNPTASEDELMLELHCPIRE